jgi:type IV pilus assembly protein PilZ
LSPERENRLAESSDEKRSHVRAPIELRVEYKRVNSFLADYTKNISRGGTFIGTDKPLPLGTRFRFRISVPDMAVPINLTGEVAWIAPPGETPGMGIRFVDLEGEAREVFELRVEKLMEKQFGADLAAKLMKK